MGEEMNGPGVGGGYLLAQATLTDLRGELVGWFDRDNHWCPLQDLGTITASQVVDRNEVAA